MAGMRGTKKRKAPRKRRSKGKAGWLGRLGLAILFLGLAGLTIFLLYFKDAAHYKGVRTEWIDSILIAADVDLAKQKQVVDKDDVTRWKITLPSDQKLKVVMRALKTGVQAQGGYWSQGKESWREGLRHNLVSLKREDGRSLRLILVVDPGNAAKPPPKVAKEAVAAVPDDSTNLLAPNRKQVVIILDDIGHHPIGQLEPVLALNLPITFAVLPYLDYSAANAIALHQRQYEVMLHMPMEANDAGTNPGRGAIVSSFNEAQIRSAVTAALQEVPFVSGVNNHMGSKITANRTLMYPVLSIVKKEGLFFIDSRTHPKTVAYNLASNMGLRTAKRDVFLDATQTYAFTLAQLTETRRVATDEGLCIAIGHPHATTLKALAEEMPKMEAEGFRFVFASAATRIRNKADH